MAAVCFQKPEVEISQPWFEIFCRHLVCANSFWPSSLWAVTKLETGVNLRCRCCHLGKSISQHNCVTYRRPMLNYMTKIKTRSRISTQRPFCFQSGSICISAADWGRKTEMHMWKNCRFI